MRSRWTLHAVLREPWMNLRAEWPQLLPVAVAVALAAGFIVWTTADAANRAIAEHRDRIARGQYVVIAQPLGGDDANLSTQSCLNVAAAPGVTATGGLHLIGTGETASHPGTPFRVMAGAGSIRRVLDPTDTTGGVNGIAAPLAHQLGTPHDTRVQLDAIVDPSGTTVASTPRLQANWFNPQTRHELGAIMWLTAARPDAVNECWIELTAAAAPHGRKIVESLLAFDTQISTRSPLDVEGLPTPQQMFAARPAAGLEAWFGLAAALPALVFLRQKRSHTALYRSLGMSRIQAAALAATQVVWTTLTATLIGGLAAALILATRHSPVSGIWPPTLKAILFVLTATLAAQVITATAFSGGNLMDQLKEQA